MFDGFRNGLVAALSLLTLLVPLAAQAPAREAALAGHYYLDGPREVGSELLLTREGRFEFMLSYGAVDQFARGSWRVAGNTLMLTTDAQEEPSFTLRRIGVAYPNGEVPQQWFDLDPRAKTQIILFRPGRLMESAFTTLEMRVVRGRKGVTLQVEGLGTFHK